MLQTTKQYTLQHFFGYEEQRKVVEDINTTLQKYDIDGVIAEHTYGAPIQFWSENKIKTMPVTSCKDNLHFLVRKSWYQPNHYSKVALIVDKDSTNKSDCSIEKITERYGKPIDTIHTQGYENSTLDIYTFPAQAVSKIEVN
jgi:hypothetical protein